jgi:hypothetical protein
VEAVGVQRPGRGLELALVTPVDLGLCPRQDLEAAVEAGRLGLGSGQAGPVLPNINLDALIVAIEPMLGDQPFMDHARLQPRLGPQPGIDQAGIRVDLARARTAPGRCRRRRRRLRREVALDGPPVMTGLPGDLRPAGPSISERLERTQFHPVLLREDHELPSSDSAGWSLPVGGWPSRRADRTARPRRPPRQAVRQTTYQGVRGHSPCPMRNRCRSGAWSTNSRVPRGVDSTGSTRPGLERQPSNAWSTSATWMKIDAAQVDGNRAHPRGSRVLGGRCAWLPQRCWSP